MIETLYTRLANFDTRLRDRYRHCLGFPNARDIDYSLLYSFFDSHLNNIGDPFAMSLSDIHSKDFEQEVIAFFADAWRAPANDHWGYITTGSTEGNLYALYTARQLLPEAVVYHSSASHYSVPKSAHIVGLETVVITAQPHGEIDYTALEAAIAERRDRPAIVVANIGTTMTEARDDVARIKHILKQHIPDKHYIHSDAALVGAYAMYMQQRPAFDFNDGADSIAVSGHKFPGVPFPCGLVMVRRSLKQNVAESIAYIAAPDTTITGSRSGHAALFLWYALQKMGHAGLRDRYNTGLKLAQDTVKKLQTAGCAAWSNPQSITVMLPAPSEALTRKWQLATANGWSHIICMPGSAPDMVAECIRDITMQAAQR